MKANHNTVIIGEQVLLCPYREEHVAQYHAWMVDLCGSIQLAGSSWLSIKGTVCHVQQDPALREATASELLSLEVCSIRCFSNIP